MNNDKIRIYDELNVSEKEVIDCFRQMKLLSDKARCELFSYKLADLLDKYNQLIWLRKDVQALLFQILGEIDNNELSVMDVDYENIGRNREVDLNHINEEVNLIQEYKVSFDEVLSIINDGTAEQMLIEEENKMM